MIRMTPRFTTSALLCGAMLVFGCDSSSGSGVVQDGVDNLINRASVLRLIEDLGLQ